MLPSSSGQDISFSCLHSEVRVLSAVPIDLYRYDIKTDVDMYYLNKFKNKRPALLRGVVFECKRKGGIWSGYRYGY